MPVANHCGVVDSRGLTPGSDRGTTGRGKYVAINSQSRISPKGVERKPHFIKRLERLLYRNRIPTIKGGHQGRILRGRSQSDKPHGRACVWD